MAATEHDESSPVQQQELERVASQSGSQARKSKKAHQRHHHKRKHKQKRKHTREGGGRHAQDHHNDENSDKDREEEVVDEEVCSAVQVSASSEAALAGYEGELEGTPRSVGALSEDMPERQRSSRADSLRGVEDEAEVGVDAEVEMDTAAVVEMDTDAAALGAERWAAKRISTTVCTEQCTNSDQPTQDTAEQLQTSGNSTKKKKKKQKPDAEEMARSSEKKKLHEEAGSEEAGGINTQSKKTKSAGEPEEATDSTRKSGGGVGVPSLYNKLAKVAQQQGRSGAEGENGKQPRGKSARRLHTSRREKRSVTTLAIPLTDRPRSRQAGDNQVRVDAVIESSSTRKRRKAKTHLKMSAKPKSSSSKTSARSRERASSAMATLSDESVATAHPIHPSVSVPVLSDAPSSTATAATAASTSSTGESRSSSDAAAAPADRRPSATASGSATSGHSASVRTTTPTSTSANAEGGYRRPHRSHMKQNQLSQSAEGGGSGSSGGSNCSGGGGGGGGGGEESRRRRRGGDATIISSSGKSRSSRSSTFASSASSPPASASVCASAPGRKSKKKGGSGRSRSTALDKMEKLSLPEVGSGKTRSSSPIQSARSNGAGGVEHRRPMSTRFSRPPVPSRPLPSTPPMKTARSLSMTPSSSRSRSFHRRSVDLSHLQGIGPAASPNAFTVKSANRMRSSPQYGTLGRRRMPSLSSSVGHLVSSSSPALTKKKTASPMVDMTQTGELRERSEKMVEKRQKIVHELLETERAYMTNLRILIEVR
jgi:hypothetical protein